ncbi:hypothetical protein RKE25_06430 [Dyella sp. BiH032]|uniref:hypothetical protein n=1 Tax=Dyella sp. BiH032 TaxID=3075430 RepID=UPI002892997F|nr:hypothetical protein [Dyella sp. BiH032]WNL47265.1 hypothetical protein RKE25_06430 [Dyella sp. BiH032]
MRNVLRVCLPALLFILHPNLSQAEISGSQWNEEIWQKIRLIEMKAAQGRESLSEVWPVPAHLQKIQRSGQLSSVEGGMVAVTSDVIITSSEIRLNKDIPVLAFFEIDGRCITVKELKRHYPDVSITDVPHSMSPEDKTYWSTEGGHGKIAFGFAQKRPACLSAVVFTPRTTRGP